MMRIHTPASENRHSTVRTVRHRIHPAEHPMLQHGQAVQPVEVGRRRRPTRLKSQDVCGPSDAGSMLAIGGDELCGTRTCNCPPHTPSRSTPRNDGSVMRL